MERMRIQAAWPTGQPFHASLQAGSLGSCEMSSHAASLRVAQLTLRADVLEMWNSVSVHCEEEPSGALVVRVLVFTPDREGALQIAELRSWPQDPGARAPLVCNLDHVEP